MSGNLGDAIADLWRSVLLFVPRALAFAAFLLVGWLLARLARSLVTRALRRVDFRRAVERGALGRVTAGRVDPADLLAKIVFYAVLLVALQAAFGVWGPNPVSDLLTALIAWLPRAFVAIVIVVVAAAVARAVADLITSALGGLPYGRLLSRITSALIVGLGVIAALDQVRIATAVTRPVLVAVLATVAGVVVVGVGGGLVRPMQARWETWLDRAGAESATIREHARAYAAERAREAEERRRADEERRAEQRRRAEEARRAEEERRRADEERRRAEEELRAAELRRAEQERRVQEERRAQETRAAAEAQAARVAAEDARRRALEAAAAERTQVLPATPPHIVPGFGPEPPAAGPPAPGTGPDATAPGAAPDVTAPLSGSHATAPGRGSEVTAPIPAGPEVTLPVPPGPERTAPLPEPAADPDDAGPDAGPEPPSPPRRRRP